MFQFGLFASHLPHLIIAAAYMIYFGVCAFDAGVEDDLEFDAHEVHIGQTVESLQIHSHIGFYDVHQCGVLNENQQIKWFKSGIADKKIFHLYEEPLYHRYPGSKVFSRPPPSC